MRYTSKHRPAPDRGDRRDSAGTLSLSAVFASTPDAVVVMALDGTVTAWNAGAGDLYGYPAEEMIGSSLERTFLEETVAEERARHQRVATGGVERGRRCTRARASGDTVEIVLSMSPVYDGDRVIGVASISRPAIDREVADFAALLEAAPDAIVCVDAAGTIVTANQQVPAVFGYQLAQLIGQPVEVLLPEGLKERHLRRQADHRTPPRAGAPRVGQQFSARKKDGTLFPVEVSLAPSSFGGEDIVIVAVRDVTVQRAVEAEVRENEARFRQLAESPNIVFILRQIDPPVLLYVSPNARRILGEDAEKFAVDPLLAKAMIHPDDLDDVTTDYLVPLRQGVPCIAEYRLLDPDGTVRWLRSAATPVHDDQGMAIRMVIMVEDVTPRMLAIAALSEAEAEARAANEAKGVFLSRMSHELRAPLNAVLGFGQILQQQLADTPHAEQIGYIVDGGRHLLKLINDVLDITRIDASTLSVNQEPVNVGDILRQCAQEIGPFAAAAGVSVTASSGLSRLDALADRQRLSQLLMNLLSNAVQYNAPGGNVWLAAEATDEKELRLYVRDDGSGIAPELMARLFTPFDRLGADRSQVQGVGIGLALTRALAELMGGTVSAVSEPGSGSCFTVRLPRAPAAITLEPSSDHVVPLPLPSPSRR